jgi:hypothetical protein
MPFGPIYYRIFSQAAPEFVPVTFGTLLTRSRAAEVSWAAVERPRSKVLPLGLLAGAGVLVGLSTVFSVATLHDRDTYEHTDWERQATEAAARFRMDRALAIGTGVTGAALGIAGTWLLLRANGSGPLRTSASVGPSTVGVTTHLVW